MAKVFHVGDTVFAKVRGYPAWPARVDKIVNGPSNRSKYHVFFYGTSETAVCKVEDLYEYEKHKEKYGKPLKRKSFSEALLEAENAKKNEHDGSDAKSKLLNEVTPDTATKQYSRKKKGTKRKIDNAFEVVGEKFADGKDSKITKCSISPPSKRLKRGSLSHMVVANADGKSVNGSPSKPEIVSRSGRKIKPRKFADDCESSSSTIDGDTSQTVDASKKNSLRGQSVASSNTSAQKQVRLRVKTPAALNNSVQESQSQKIDNIEQRNSTLSDEEKRKIRLTWFRIEASMLETESKLINNLNIDKANTVESVNLLTHLDKLHIEPLMLKKHPSVVYTIRKLRRYVGNPGGWNLTAAQEQKFNAEALQIRNMCNSLFDKFRSMFTVPEDSNFSDVFAEAVATFKKKTESLSAEQFCALIVEPSDRRGNLCNEEKSPGESQQETEEIGTQNPSQIPDPQELPRDAEMPKTLLSATIKSEPLDEIESANDTPSTSFPADGTSEIGELKPKTEVCMDENNDGN